MTREEFSIKIEEEAIEYANSMVEDAEEHQDAVEAITYDYIEGALKAYELLVN